VGLPIAGAGASIQFDTFFQERHEQLFKALYFVTGDHRDAEELMQDAFLKLWER
jgi:DNA-directed RNA polymerase specialized sigma24 family protein